MDATQADREKRRLAEGREALLSTVMKAESKGKLGSIPYQNYLVRQALEELAGRIKADQKANAGAGHYKKFALYLGSIDPLIASLRAIQAVLEVLLREGGADAPSPVWKKAGYAAGQAVYQEYLMRHFKEVNPAIFNSLAREYSRSMTSDERHMVHAFKAKFAKEGIAFPVWDFGDIEQVGNYLLTQLVAIKFLETWSRTESKKGKAYTVKYLQLDPALRLNSLEIMDAVANAPRIAGPLIEQPLDWDAETNMGGGFHTEDMRRQAAYAVQGKGIGRVAERTVAMLNHLQHVEWTVDADVLSIVRQVSVKKDFGDVVSPIVREKPVFEESFNDDQKKAWKAEARKWYTEKKVRTVKHLRSQKIFREAAELSLYPTIWFTYYADFRGRAYSRSASVSPQGGDLEKGLLRLKNGKALDSASSKHWFKVHGSNKFGNDKMPLGPRAQWVDDNHAHLIQMAADPVAHSEWAEAENPVQFLAWVREYAEFTRDPEGFRSHLAVSMDGTCNGLQNFSALMCDSVGGAAVNLVPGPAPRDIYADVAVRVSELLEEDVPGELRDGWLKHGMNRKITKRPTMTMPYSSTRFAASSFIMDYIEDEDTPPLLEIPSESWGDAANYLSYKVWDGLGDTVVKAAEVMAWLQGWAKHAVINDRPVAWVAPSGLHVVSEYEGMRKKRVKSVAFQTRIMLYEPTGKSDPRKVANAVAPNFVHSLDASHMERVVARAIAEGMTPVTIHDDFGVHAADTERFHEIIREEFVAMYEGNTLLEDMAASTGYDVPIPERGDLNLRDILTSEYFFH